MRKVCCVLFFLLLNCVPCVSNGIDTKNYFDDILLIINFNHPYYDNIPFLKEIYSPYFKNMVFYGEKSHPEVNIVKQHKGFYVQRAIRHAMKKYPNYNGYICCQDDCFMNFWNLTRLDKQKIWLHQYWIAPLNTSKIAWEWWSYPSGYAASVRAFLKLGSKAKTFLEANCGKLNFAYTWSDFIYVPKKYSKNFIKNSVCFKDPNVFIEIALPTILLSLDDYSNFEHLNPYWGGTVSSIDLSTYKTDYDWVHPIKLSKPENRNFIRNVISNINHAK